MNVTSSGSGNIFGKMLEKKRKEKLNETNPSQENNPVKEVVPQIVGIQPLKNVLQVVQTQQVQKTLPKPKAKTATNSFFGYHPPDPNEIKPSQILGKTELNAMLFKIKKYYNALNKQKTEKANTLDHLKEQSHNFEKKIDELIAFKDIEFKNENISVKEITTLKETKEEIRENIQKLLDEKKNLDEKYKNELEYSNTLTHMITAEKNNLERLNEILVTSQEKILALKYTRRNFDANIEEDKKKNGIFKNVIRNLDEEMANLDDLIKFQNEEMQKLTGNLDQEEKEVQQLRVSIEQKNIDLGNEIKKEKERILMKIKQTEEIKNNKINKESEYIKLVLGLDIIKKYYVDVDKEGKEINNSVFLNSEDYRIFTADRYNVYDNESGAIILNTNSISYDDKIETLNNNVNSPGTRTAKIYLKDIKEKFDNLEIEYESLCNFYTKIITKTAFFHNNMMNLNFKIINLESKKDLYTKRVVTIMSKSYKNFDDLIKSNSRFQNFMESLQTELRTNRKAKNVEILLSRINSHNNVRPPIYVEFYEKLTEIISLLKSYYETIHLSFKYMIREIFNIPDAKVVMDSMRSTNKKIKAYINHNWVEMKKKTRAEYTTDLLALAENDIMIKGKLELDHNISVTKLKDFIYHNLHAEYLGKTNLKIEKDNFYFVLNTKGMTEILKTIYSTIDVVEARYKYSEAVDINPDMVGARKKRSVYREFGNYLGMYWAISQGSSVENKNLEDSYLSNKDNIETNANVSKKRSRVTSQYRSKNEKESPRKPPATAGGITSRKIQQSNIPLTSGNSAPIANPLSQSSNNININTKIIQKFYMPFIEKRSYNMKLNENIGMIKKNTRKSAILSHYLNKKKKEIDGIAKELIIYNNPSKFILIFRNKS